MSKFIRGRCHCQKIKFQLTPPSEYCAHCHCESCRRLMGAAFATWVSVPNDQLKIIEGEHLIKTYTSSKGIIWMSCNKCTSPLFQTTHKTPDRTYIIVASLSDKLDRQPECHVSFNEKVDWIGINDDLPHHEEKASDLLNQSKLSPCQIRPNP